MGYKELAKRSVLQPPAQLRPVGDYAPEGRASSSPMRK